MIQGFSDYEKTEVKDFGAKERITLGGHICKILGVEIENVTSKKDNKIYTVLRFKFDLEAPDAQAGFYNRKFAEDAKADAMKAKWKGTHSVTIPSNESEDFIKSNWKAFLTSIEKSNPGVVLDGNKGFDEKLLIGKIFGGIFGMEEFTIPEDGRTITFTRLRFIRSTEKIEEAPIPSVRLLDGTYVKYEEYKTGNANNSSNNSNSVSEFSTLDSDDLPF